MAKKHEEKANATPQEQVEETAASSLEKEYKKQDKKALKEDLAAKLASAEAKAEAADAKADETKETLLRTAAEYDNFRKRSQKEQEQSFSNGISYAAEQLLSVLDALDAAASATTADEEYKKGVLMTLSTAKEAFNKMGIAEIEALGKEFDPDLHNAIIQQPADGAESGEVTQVIQKGYALNGKVIRHSMVAVAP